MCKLCRTAGKRLFLSLTPLLVVALFGTFFPHDATAQGGDKLQWDKPVSYKAPAPVSEPESMATPKKRGGHKLFQDGLNYFKGEGAPKNQAMAVVLWHKAAEAGDRDAQSCLAYLYYTGLGGVSQSYKKAAKWYLMAAKAGASDAQHNIGVMYYHGQGVPKDNVRAMTWFILSSANGYDLASKELRYVAGGSTPEQISKARTMASGYLH